MSIKRLMDLDATVVSVIVGVSRTGPTVETNAHP